MRGEEIASASTEDQGRGPLLNLKSCSFFIFPDRVPGNTLTLNIITFVIDF